MDLKSQTKTETAAPRFTSAGLVLHFVKGSVPLFLLSIVFSGFSSLADMLDPQIIRITIDSVIGGMPSDLPAWAEGLIERIGGYAYLREKLWIMALAVVAVALLRMVAHYFQMVFANRASETLVKRMRDLLFSHIERLPYRWHMEHHTGDIIQRCTSDVDKVRRFVAMQLAAVLRLGLYLVMSLWFMFRMNIRLALIALAPIPFIFAYSIGYRRQMSDGFRLCDEEEGRVSSVVQENLTGVRVVRAFGMEESELKRFEDKNEYYTSLWVRMGAVMAKFFSIQDTLFGCQTLLVIALGAVFCVRGGMTAGEYIAFLSYNAMLAKPVRRMGRMISEMSKAGVSIRRIAEIMNAEEEKDAPGAEDADMSGDIVFDHVSFGYGDGPEILHDVDFTIPAGSTLGILGGTGSGKSTLMLLLDRMYDIPEGCGRITVGGRDIKTIRTGCVRSNISIVLQEPFLFSRSIRDNIGIVAPGITDDEIKKASRAACLDESVEGFARGYDTFVGERGVTLSGGQKQRAAIARALTKDAPILVFDDSLSAVDTETDAKIRASIEERFGSATVILVSHRITTLSKADHLIVLENGRIAEQGSPAELQHAGGLYQKIYEIQSGMAESGKEESREE